MSAQIQPGGQSTLNPMLPPRSETTLVEQELISSVAWLIRLRWIAGIGVLLATWLADELFSLGVPSFQIYCIGTGILLYNLVFYLIERRFTREQQSANASYQLAIWQVGLDWLSMTLLIHYTGGIESPVLFFFIFHIIIASIFFPPLTAYAFALLAILLVLAITLLEFLGVIPHYLIQGYLSTPLFNNRMFLSAVLLFFAGTGLISAYLASSIHKRLRQREDEIIELSRNLQRATIQLQALNESARTVGSTLELTQVLERLVETTARAMGVRACSIRLLDKSGRLLEPVAVYGLSQTYLQKGPVDAVANPLAREVLGGKVVNIPDVLESPLLQYPEEARQEGIRSMLSAPLIGKSGPLGILRAYAVEQNRFTKDDEAFLAAIAAQGSIAIENALAYHAVEELDATKTNFIRTVTHELRSPVSVTQSLLRTLTAGYAGAISPQQKDILARATRRVEFLQKLIDDLLDLAAGKSDIKALTEIKPVELIPCIEKVVRRFEVSAREKGLHLDLQIDCQAAQPVVNATPEGLDRIFDNLLSNAIKYTPSGGSVDVSVACLDSDVLITVVDTGIGIPKEAQEHIFEEFYRAPNAREVEHEGTGLGLTIVKDLLTRFGGRIALQSELGKGTRFMVTLPLVSPRTVESDHSRSNEFERSSRQ